MPYMLCLININKFISEKSSTLTVHNKEKKTQFDMRAVSNE